MTKLACSWLCVVMCASFCVMTFRLGGWHSEEIKNNASGIEMIKTQFVSYDRGLTENFTQVYSCISFTHKHDTFPRSIPTLTARTSSSFSFSLLSALFLPFFAKSQRGESFMLCVLHTNDLFVEYSKLLLLQRHASNNSHRCSGTMLGCGFSPSRLRR